MFNLIQSDVSFKLKLKESHTTIESNYTETIAPKKLIKEEVTIYDWFGGSELKTSTTPGLARENTMSLHAVLSMADLRSSNISINMYDTVFVDVNTDDNECRDRVQEHGSLTNSMGGHTSLSSKSTNNFQNLFKKNPLRISSVQDIIVPNFTSKSTTVNFNNINLKSKYTLIGYSNLNFYKILSENDNNINRQTSKFFNAGFNDINQFSNKNLNSLASEEKNQIIKFQMFDDLTKNFSEDIFIQGNAVGKMEGMVSIIKIPLIRQIMCGVHTEKGFDIHSINFNFDTASLKDVRNITEPPELKILNNQRNFLLQNLLKKMNLSQVGSLRELNSNTLHNLKEIKCQLEKSNKESCLYYRYENNKDIFTAQKIMLDIGTNIMKGIEEFDTDQRSICFEILNLINNRAELDLGTVSKIWFSVSNNEYCFSDVSILNDKIIENFIDFNNQCLGFTLDRLGLGKNADKESRSFVEFYLSFAYFRIPEFRNSFLEVISDELYSSKKNQAEIEKNNQKIEEFLELDPINTLILWEVLFYSRLEKSLKNSANSVENEISEKLKETKIIIGEIDGKEVLTEWKERFKKRGVMFHSMIVKLEQYIRKKVVKEIDIKWANIPGFPVIIDAIFNEINTKNVSMYTPHFIQVLSLFVNDSEIINKFTRAIIRKTNVYDTIAVFNLVKILDSFFSKYEEKKGISNLAMGFDYNLLKQSFLVIMENDHSLSVGKFIWLYYKNAHIMNFEHVAEISITIINERFFELFFHWSWQVRNIFYYIILFTINYRIRHMNFEINYSLSRRRGSIAEKQEVNFPENLRNKLIEEFDKKMKIINLIEKIIHEEKLDPSFNTKFKDINMPEFRVIPVELGKNIVVSMHHFDTLKKQFLKWEEENKRKHFSEIRYPALDLEPPKDDVVQYTEINW